MKTPERLEEALLDDLHGLILNPGLEGRVLLNGLLEGHAAVAARRHKHRHLKGSITVLEPEAAQTLLVNLFPDDVYALLSSMSASIISMGYGSKV
jgi:hypothetical protein